LLFPQDWGLGVAYLGNDEITYIYRLRSQDLPIWCVQQLYDGFSCQVIHDGNLTEPFTVTTSVKQACILPPLLFLMVIDWVS
jgi:hypothetical protein